ncbi:hypothetical protein N9H37_01280 [Congregibacter sp.]|nr:hypothetical protein [Congregibacter sp.]MDA8961973.1 hypothetical protein [Congregibacter sp.]
MDSLKLAFKAGRLLRERGLLAASKAVFYYFNPLRAESWTAIKREISALNVIEVGGASSIFSDKGILPIYTTARSVDNCTFAPNTIWNKNTEPGDTFFYCKGKANGHQYFGEANELSKIIHKPYECLMSSHVLEHLANPIAALIDWKNVLTENGLLLLVVPHKEGSFDHRRSTTTISHLIEDFANGTGEDDLTHLDEILKCHDFTKDPEARSVDEFAERARANLTVRGLHHHVFTAPLVAQMLDYSNYQIESIESFIPLHIVATARPVHTESGRADNSEYLTSEAKYLKLSPFSSDRFDAQKFDVVRSG